MHPRISPTIHQESPDHQSSPYLQVLCLELAVAKDRHKGHLRSRKFTGSTGQGLQAFPIHLGMTGNNGNRNRTGWWARATPLKNMSPSIGMISNPILMGKKHVPNHQPDKIKPVLTIHKFRDQALHFEWTLAPQAPHHPNISKYWIWESSTSKPWRNQPSDPSWGRSPSPEHLIASFKGPFVLWMEKHISLISLAKQTQWYRAQEAWKWHVMSSQHLRPWKSWNVFRMEAFEANSSQNWFGTWSFLYINIKIRTRIHR